MRKGRIAFRLVAACAAVMVAGVALAQPQRTQQQEPVSLYVTVEHKGDLVTGLTEENFRVREQGEPVDFELAAPEPTTIALLVEHSRRSAPYWRDIERAVDAFGTAAPEGQQYLLATFANRLEVQELSEFPGSVTQDFHGRGVPIASEVSLYDAVYEMLQRLEQQPGRRVLVIVASGMDSLGRRTLAEVERKIEEADVVVYGIGVGSALRGRLEPWVRRGVRMDLLQGQAFLQMLAERSGGQAWFPMQEGAYTDVMRGAMQNVEHHYRIVLTARYGEVGPIEVEAFRFVAEDRRQDFDVRVRERLRREEGAAARN